MRPGLYDSGGTWFAAEEVAKRAREKQILEAALDALDQATSEPGQRAYEVAMAALGGGVRPWGVGWPRRPERRAWAAVETALAGPRADALADLRKIHDRLDRKGVAVDAVLALLQEYHSAVGELLARGGL